MELRTQQHNAPFGATAACLFMLASCTSGAPATTSSAGASATVTPQGVNQNAGAAASTASLTPSATAPITGKSVETGGSPATPSGQAGAAAEPAPAALPCAVSKAVAANCLKCHGATPVGGAPMSLVSQADFQKPAKTMPTLKVYELAKMRLQDTAKPMPPGGTISAADSATLLAWLDGGAMPGADTDTSCGADMTVPTEQSASSATDGTHTELTALPGETCYDFPVHQGQTLDDTTPYTIVPGEHYELYYFRAPWPDGSVATRYGTKVDNAPIVHHWLLFTTAETDAAGTHKTSPVPTLIGVNATMLAGWAVGGTNVGTPDDVGLELPAHGTTLDVQWHYYNTTTGNLTDHSALQICTVPAGARAHTASITWLGTENLNGNKWFGGAGMPPHQVSSFSGTCTPSRAGLKSDEPIHILAFWPHMHRLGTHMKTVVNHKGGASETIFDKAFDFNYQLHYSQAYDLKPGDTLTSTCTYNNTTDKGAPFGESTDTEMCYQFTYSWPAHALDNHAASLIGTSNTCW